VSTSGANGGDGKSVRERRRAAAVLGIVVAVKE
jgi:hypothetical protein